MQHHKGLRKGFIPVAVGILGAMLLAALLKFWLVTKGVLPFNSDEAIVALMARHILEGAKPIFFYGQAYMGSLDAWLVAGGFWIFGQQVWVIRLIQGCLYLGVLLSTYKLGTVAFGSKRVGLGAMWLLAVPNVIVTLYTTVSLGGYGEGLLLGNLIFLTGFQITQDLERNKPIDFWRWLLWGFLAGTGLWVFGLTLIYSLTMGIFILIRLWSQEGGLRGYVSANHKWNPIDLLFIGGLIGSLPWLFFAFQQGLGLLLRELLGSAVAVESTPWLGRVGQHLVNLVLFGATAVFGLRPSWEIRWLAVPLIPFVLAFWLGVMLYIGARFRKGKEFRFEAMVMAGTMLLLSGGFIFTSFGVDPSGRYFIPLVIPLSLFAAEMVQSLADRYGRWAWGLIPLIMIFNGWGIVQSANRNPPGITTQFNQITQVDHQSIGDLIRFLQIHEETRGYTNYWVTYPLAFNSQEQLIFTPRLPYHEDFRYTPRDDRYDPYVNTVEQASKVAFITTLHPALDEYLRVEFNKLGVDWEEELIGDYQVFYNLSEVVRPEEIGLGAVPP